MTHQMGDQEFEELKRDVAKVKRDLTGDANQPGVHEKLRHLERLVKIAIFVSFASGAVNAGTSINWELVLKLLQ